MAVHSRGSMTPANLPSFVSRVAPDFRRLSAALQTVGVLQAITTHSDTAEHDKFEHGERPRAGRSCQLIRPRWAGPDLSAAC